ncbi:MAG: efflux RND transporter periplasmic adaptor subunit [Legionellaceae bacterium]|nr:efflux RND transporter periplasmic adaptor subunit [Legionellaceae bacterium]
MTSDNRSKLIKIVILGVIVFLLIHLVRFFTKSTVQPVPPPSVAIQKPTVSNLAEYITQTGTMVAMNSVNLVARVEGYLDAIEFTDGTFIKKDRELFVIEPKPYLEKWKAAKANVAAQKALYAYDKSEYERQKRMYKQNATSLNNVEKWEAKSLQSQAEIEKAVADAEIAAINYSYTHVHAPFDGRIGRHLIDVGNLVGHGEATDLATIEQIDPIYVYFNLSELDLLKIRDAMRLQKFNPDNINQVSIYVNMQNETGFLHEGKMNFVNTGLNASTGTMEVRALLSNKEYTLLPGLFVQVRVPISKPKPQLMIPDTAVEYDQIGPYVVIVDKTNVVVIKRVILGVLEHDQRAILKGLEPQDSVIISGTQNAFPGVLVRPIQSENKST